MPEWVNTGFDMYARRMPRESPFRLRELKPAPRTNAASNVEKWLEIESARIRDALPTGALRVVLDEKGRGFRTEKLADYLRQWRDAARDAAFVIGGADGLAPRIKREADLLWSLSPLTLPHGLVRVVLAEQLYRATTILLNHPYHRE
jgi:23S rRNA (pseudouridine1915-N3)-methyltransferase